MEITVRTDSETWQAHSPGCQHLNLASSTFDVEADPTQDAIEAAVEEMGFEDTLVLLAPCVVKP